MSQFISLILMAVIVEGLITYARTFIVSGKFQWQMFLAIIIGIIVTLIYNVDIFSMLGIVTAVPFVGNVLTGIIISRGSNYIFDLIKSLQNAGNGISKIDSAEGSNNSFSKGTTKAANVTINNATISDQPSNEKTVQ